MRHRLTKDDDWASLIINQVYDEKNGDVLGYILVWDPQIHDPKWKLAGGHKEPGETPLMTAIRENKGETGLSLPPEAYTEIKAGHEWRRRPTGHWSFLFLARVPYSEALLINSNDIENEGEIPRFFTKVEFEIEILYETILPSHLKKLQLAVQLPA